MPDIDTVFRFKSPVGGVGSHCRVRLFKSGRKNVVILTEASNNPGMSVSSAAVAIASAVVRQYKLDPERTTWIEHFPSEPGGPAEGFDLIELVWEGQQFNKDPESRAITRKQVERLIGESLPEE